LVAVYSSYEAVCGELDRRRRVALGFERIEALLRLLDNPHHSLKVVQVVGTNGKGTTSVTLASALEAAGHCTGAYLSPHVLSYTERTMLHARYASEEEFAVAMWRAIEIADANDIPATQFELLTAGALLMFREAGAEWAVLEAGLGARYDATSAAEPQATVLTNVSLDHTEYLGDTIEQIAEEKLASVRPGGILVLGTNDPRVIGIARDISATVGARVVVPEEMRKPCCEVGEVTYLVRNECLGLRAAEVLLNRALRGDEREAALTSARAVRSPARFEIHELRGVPVVVDGGHNPDGLKATLQAVRASYGERPLGVVFGVLKEKDVGSMLNALEGEAQALVLTRPDNTDGRALDPRLIEEAYDPRDAGGRRARTVSDVAEALHVAVGEIQEAVGVVLVTGSLYTGAGILRWLRER
jgi:dihydrofolate synthase/folylpolyglutamate synthase